jgi:hypothetical protein
MVGFTVFNFIKVVIEGIKGKNSGKDFDSRMENRGFTKRIVVYDNISGFSKINTFGAKHWWTVGIWINYQEQLIALRTDRNNWNAIIIPFDQIQNAEIIEDDYIETTAHSELIRVRATSTEFCKGLKIRIVTGDIRTGTNAYYLNLYNPKWNAKFKKSDMFYKYIQECAWSITDEICNIINNTRYY